MADIDIKNIPEVDTNELDELEKKEQQSINDKADDALKSNGAPSDDKETTKDEQKTDDDAQAHEDEPKEKEIDYKTKFQESQRESIALHQSIREKEEKIKELSRPKEVSENELKEKYPDWEDMTEREKKLARENENTKLRLTNLEAQNSIYHNEKAWSQKISDQVKEWDTYQKFPRIVDRKDEFTKFCKMPSHKNIGLETLAKAFLYEVKEPAKKKASTPMTSTKSAKNTTPAKKKWTGEEVQALRENSPSKYQQLVLKGEFDDLAED